MTTSTATEYNRGFEDALMLVAQRLGSEGEMSVRDLLNAFNPRAARVFRKARGAAPVIVIPED